MIGGVKGNLTRNWLHRHLNSASHLLFQIQHLTILSIELHMQTRRDLCPDPNFDPICAIFYHLISDTDDSKETGIFVVDSNQSNHKEASTISGTTAQTTEQLNRSPGIVLLDRIRFLTLK